MTCLEELKERAIFEAGVGGYMLADDTGYFSVGDTREEGKAHQSSCLCCWSYAYSKKFCIDCTSWIKNVSVCIYITPQCGQHLYNGDIEACPLNIEAFASLAGVPH